MPGRDGIPLKKRKKMGQCMSHQTNTKKKTKNTKKTPKANLDVGPLLSHWYCTRLLRKKSKYSGKKVWILDCDRVCFRPEIWRNLSWKGRWPQSTPLGPLAAKQLVALKALMEEPRYRHYQKSRGSSQNAADLKQLIYNHLKLSKVI